MDETQGIPPAPPPETEPLRPAEPAAATMPPAPPLAPDPAAPAGPSPTETVIASLAGTAAWTRFIAILGFIGAGFMAVVGIGVLVFGLPGEAEDGANLMRLLGLVYLALAGIYLIPLLPLNQFASDAARLKGNPSLGIAAEALRHNRSFWKRIGIISIVSMALSAVVLVAMIIVVIIAALNRS